MLRPLLDGRPYLPWTEGALRPAALVAVLNEIVLSTRTTIVELGSGMSTVIIARLLAERGGTLTSLEHDPAWAAVVRSQLEVEDLDSVARLEVAPLELHAQSWAGAPWYGAEAVRTLPSGIELLLVDGPPGYGDGMAHSRYPALPVLHERLAGGAVVILDDADREPEREIADRWEDAMPGWGFGVDRTAGVAIGRRRA